VRVVLSHRLVARTVQRRNRSRLSIVDSLVYAHGCTFSVTTAREGCRFTVKMPRIAAWRFRWLTLAQLAMAALILPAPRRATRASGLRSTFAKPKSGQVVCREDVTCRCGTSSRADQP